MTLLSGGFEETVFDATVTMLELVRNRALCIGHETALEVVGFEGHEVTLENHSWKQLWDLTATAADALSQSGVGEGDRVLLLVADPASFLAWFLGSHGLGAIPVPLPARAAGGGKANLPRIVAAAQGSSARAAVLDETAARSDIEALRSLALLTATSLSSNLGSAAIEVRRPPDEVAFLQYTSGSTSAPRGVMVLHRNLAANMRALARAVSLHSRDVTYSWLPLYHDMGLIAGLLLGLRAGIRTCVARPETFVNSPASWLRAISTLGATFSAGPNFAYDALAHRTPDHKLENLRLDEWRVALCGGEPIDARTAEAFCSRFESRGFSPESFRPGYGLAEATLATTVTPPGRRPRFDCVDRGALSAEGMAVQVPRGSAGSLLVASVGRAVADHEVAVVDTTGAEVPPRTLGEIVVRGASVTPGYYGQPGSHPWTEIRTGDLGYLADGELHVVDRLKDLLIIAGRKYASSDLENALAGVTGLRKGAIAAFCVRERSATDELYLAAVADGTRLRPQEQLLSDVRALIHREFALTVSGLFVVGSKDFPRTSSGKLRRSECRRLFENGTLQRAHAARLQRVLG